jgi:competence protein ComGC
VLLTLAIIAVVAIMTIPNLMQEKAKSETVTGYKKAYSTLTNAVKTETPIFRPPIIY